MTVADTNAEPTTQQHRWGQEQEQEASKSYALSGKIMLASIIVLFVVVVFLLLLHLYARWYLLRLQRNNPNQRRDRRNRSRRVVFYVDSNRTPSTPTGGLDPSILKSLPLFVYSSKPDSDANTPECAVCLSEFETGETGRVLPKCKHSFHTECIDMWFHSNSTCPLCRSTVEPVHICEPDQDVKILIEPGSSRPDKSVTEPGSSNVNETVSYGDKRKGVDIRIDVPNRSELRVETGLRIMSPSQGFRSPRNMLMRILTMSRKSPAVSPSGVGPSFLAPTTESHVELASESSR
ncbi:Zinc finger, RING/FYVE/PHD-type [Artemisia annua]|uniref:RING-type E3 ubiquitin transferase n=1 Tax=Artemisia annua TaxID=35608 RepID=A0A2U1P812_ARTAN|nr:Zinc finger, RING/FYVE/PHD-type [Artemisia annua]